MTIPDQSMTVREIQIRFAQGLPVTDTRTPIYNGDEDIFKGVDPKSLDIVEVNAIIKERIQEAAETKHRVQAEVAERQAAAEKLKADQRAKEIAEEVERREKEINKLLRQRRQTNTDFNE